MGPNSGGGRKNKDNNNPQGAARARFSKWRPPTKNLKEKFSKQHETRAIQEHEVKKNPDGEHGSKVNAGGGKSVAKGKDKNVRSTEKSAKNQTAVPSGEFITITEEIVSELLRIFNVEQTKTMVKSCDSAPLSTSAAKIAIPAPTQPAKLVHFLSSTTTAAVTVASNSSTNGATGTNPGRADTGVPAAAAIAVDQSKVAALKRFGFTVEEMTSVLSNPAVTHSKAGDKVKYSETEALLGHLMHVSGHTIPSPNTTTTSNNSTSGVNEYILSNNEELMTEIEVLSSIYVCNVTHKCVVLFGRPCCVRWRRAPRRSCWRLASGPRRGGYMPLRLWFLLGRQVAAVRAVRAVGGWPWRCRHSSVCWRRRRRSRHWLPPR